MGLVEQYHKPLRRAYEIIKEEIGASDTEEQRGIILQMDVKAINDTAGYDGIVPTLLVFGAFPRISNMDPPAPSITKRAAALKKAMAEVSKIRAQRHVSDALRTRNGPVTTDIALGSDVLVWRVHENSWNGPYKLLAITGETATVQMPHGPSDFRTTNVRKFNTPIDIQNEPPSNNMTPKIRPAHLTRRQPVRNAGLPFRYRDRTANAFEKSRLVVQAFKDNDKKTVLTQSPTIQRMSQRLLICLALYKNFDIFTRDISQAYTQSKSHLVRNFFVRPPAELDLPNDVFLKVLLPLYGVPEAGTHWFRTYLNHHIVKLDLIQSSYDQCLLFNSDAIVGLQTHDTLIACNNNFKSKESEELKKANFAAKDLEELSCNNPFTFNGAQSSKSNLSIYVSQKDQIKKLAQVKGLNQNEYISQRARGAYISSVCQPQVALGLSHAACHDPNTAQATRPSGVDFDRLNKCLQWQLENPSKGLNFVQLKGKLRLITFTDLSFANNPDYSSQMGYLIILADEYDNCNVIHWASIKCKLITRSVIASELYAMSHGFDVASVLKNSLDKVLDSKVPIIICIDSFSLYECLVKLGTTYEKRLIIDIMAIRQAYERREIAEVIWITGESNPADAMTKHKSNDALSQIIDNNKINLKAAAWVERQDLGKEAT
ncbi:hypothetical protein K3495_g13278 [Podosphaera aphanis]|nr:hypothetical protein K3495_g13278 [Podosphaera aphanis]